MAQELTKKTYKLLAEELRQARLAVSPLVKEGNPHGLAAGDHINQAESLLVRLCSDLEVESRSTP